MSRDNLTKIILPESRLPRFWYNVQADMPNPLSPGLNPQTLEALTPADLEPIFARELIAQEVSTERYIEIPE
ncbi:MAG TPA: TrpB-like pyridoxal-phosphate dependent enzyme, partial [Syntrophomonadaceae bacterium]|nr:TrpB-like pyridoxal-phosphate dependent enzyme [Syntrophomonadaceae bacterium]